jgi:DNA-binding IclR family transcriptional regulator
MELVDRVFNILELFRDQNDNKEALSITELSKLSGYSPAVTHRIVTSLVKRGYVIQKEKRGKYSLGLKFLEFSYVIRKNIEIANIADPFLLDLNKEADEAVTLAILDSNEILVIERLDVSHDLNVSGAVGKRAPLHSTAIGKLFLAHMSHKERETFFKGDTIKKHTKNTITDFEEMEKELDLFRVEGCTFDREETALGVWSVAAPVYNFAGKIATGVAIVAPTIRINDQNIKRMISLAKSCAANISRNMGYRGLEDEYLMTETG